MAPLLGMGAALFGHFLGLYEGRATHCSRAEWETLARLDSILGGDLSRDEPI